MKNMLKKSIVWTVETVWKIDQKHSGFGFIVLIIVWCLIGWPLSWLWDHYVLGLGR